MACGHTSLTVLSLVVVVGVCAGSQTSTAPVNISCFSQPEAGSRLAYYRWKDWLMAHPAVLHKVPPSPKMTLLQPQRLLDVMAVLTPVTVFQVDAAQQTVGMLATLLMWWRDPALALDHALIHRFTDGNASQLPYSLSVPVHALWMPLVVYSEGMTSRTAMDDVVQTTVRSDGTVVVAANVQLTFGCRFSMTQYPFDQHRCPLTLFDVSNSANVLPLGQPWVDQLSLDFGVGGEWDMVNVTSNALSNAFFGGQGYAQFVLHLRRKTTFYSVVMVFPMVLTSYLNVVVFLLPPDLGDKASYLVTLTVSMSVYAAFFNSDMPRGLVSVPRIFVLLIFVYAESFVILVMCVVVLRKYKAEQGDPQAEGTSRESQGTVCSRADEKEGRVKRWSLGAVSAKRLDNFFFLLAFVSNTVGLACILTFLVGG